MLVRYLIDINTITWKDGLLRQLFSPIDVDRIKNIPISRRLPNDKLVWEHTKNGIYSVKFGYWVRRRRGTTINHKCWDIIWKAKTIPKS